MDGRWSSLKIFGIALALASAAGAPSLAQAGTFELSLGGSFSQSNYGGGNYSWERRWGGSVGYYFLALSQVELSFQDVTDRTNLSGYQDTTFHDQILSLNWVQSLTGKSFPIQPYLKAGIGQLNREATGTYAGGASPPRVVAQLTGIVGAGLRIYITRAFAIRTEATSYLVGGNISTWQDNFSLNVGLSFSF